MQTLVSHEEEENSREPESSRVIELSDSLKSAATVAVTCRYLHNAV